MRSLHEVLTRSSRRAPESLCLDLGRKQITFGDLDQRSARLARGLRSLGVRKGDRVGLLLAKSVDAYAAMYAVLRAGGVIVPLDIRFPQKRIDAIGRKCGMRVLIADAARLESVPLTAEHVVLVGTALATELPRHGTAHRAEELRGRSPAAGSSSRDGDPAYILFTSGSTGSPKGVVISHRAALWFVLWSADHFALGPRDRVLNIAPFIFDLSVFEVHATMHAGGTVIPVPDGHASFPRRVAETLASRRVTTLYLTPSQLRLLLAKGMLASHDLSALRQVLVAGEAFDADLARAVREKLPGVDCFNLYGPTETNVCTVYRLDARAVGLSQEIPIGRPCRGCEIALVDHFGRPVAGTAVGELLVRSPGVMTGYWRDAKATRRALRRPRGWDGEFYRTGDMAARNEAGELLFRGRVDGQVKYRGHRIELAEIEGALCSHPGVVEAVAVLVSDGGAGRVGGRLIAFARSRSRTPIGERELLAHCADVLPRFMIPEEIVACEALPLSLTGKRPRVVEAGVLPSLNSR